MMWVFPTSDLMYQFSVSNRYAMEVILSFSLLLVVCILRYIVLIFFESLKQILNVAKYVYEYKGASSNVAFPKDSNLFYYITKQTTFIDPVYFNLM